jgi:hypothetical protein
METRRGRAVISAINIPCTSSSPYKQRIFSSRDKLCWADVPTPLSLLCSTSTHVCKFCQAADAPACALFDFGLFTSRAERICQRSLSSCSLRNVFFSSRQAFLSAVVHLAADRRPHLPLSLAPDQFCCSGRLKLLLFQVSALIGADSRIWSARVAAFGSVNGRGRRREQIGLERRSTNTSNRPQRNLWRECPSK